MIAVSITILCVSDSKRSIHKNHELISSILVAISVFLVVTYSNYSLVCHLELTHEFLFKHNEFFYGQGLILYNKIFIALFLAIYLIIVFVIIMILYSLSDEVKFSVEIVNVMVIAGLGGVFMIISSDIFVSFIGLELISLILYVIIALDKSVSLGIEGSVKYFILGSFVSGMLILGVCWLYLIVGTSELTLGSTIINCSAAEPFTYNCGIAIILLICALLFKLGIPPFHT